MAEPRQKSNACDSCSDLKCVFYQGHEKQWILHMFQVLLPGTHLTYMTSNMHKYTYCVYINSLIIFSLKLFRAENNEEVIDGEQ